ncbi:unnamed protein product [Cunninghamella blakesleeana]
MQQHSFFPPLLIGHGTEAMRVCQKYVCNKPVSGLVLVDDGKHMEKDDDESLLPSMEFEPYFPIYLICPTKKIPAFLKECDHIDPSTHQLQHMIDWMEVHL